MSVLLTELIPEERVLKLIEVAESYPNTTEVIESKSAYNDVALLLRELLERRKTCS